MAAWIIRSLSLKTVFGDTERTAHWASVRPVNISRVYFAVCETGTNTPDFIVHTEFKTNAKKYAYI